jgi:hypothetical protein
MAWWGWLLLVAYLPVAALQAVWLGSAIERIERREARRARSSQPPGERRPLTVTVRPRVVSRIGSGGARRPEFEGHGRTGRRGTQP